MNLTTGSPSSEDLGEMLPITRTEYVQNYGHHFFIAVD